MYSNNIKTLVKYPFAKLRHELVSTFYPDLKNADLKSHRFKALSVYDIRHPQRSAGTANAKTS